jgi:hypothetical protein
VGDAVPIGVATLAGQPEIAIDRRPAPLRPIGELRRAALVPGGPAARRDALLHRQHEAVEVDRHDIGGAHRGEHGRIAEPARAEIPSALRGCAQMALHHRRWPSFVRGRGSDIFGMGFVARCVPVVPIAVEQAAVRHPDDAFARAAGVDTGSASHPERMLAPQRRQPPRGQPGTLLLGQVEHQREEGRLRPAEIVSAHAVGDVTVPLDDADEIGQHRFDQRLLPVLRRA